MILPGNLSNVLQKTLVIILQQAAGAVDLQGVLGELTVGRVFAHLSTCVHTILFTYHLADKVL